MPKHNLWVQRVLPQLGIMAVLSRDNTGQMTISNLHTGSFIIIAEKAIFLTMVQALSFNSMEERG